MSWDCPYQIGDMPDCKRLEKVCKPLQKGCVLEESPAISAIQTSEPINPGLPEEISGKP